MPGSRPIRVIHGHHDSSQGRVADYYLPDPSLSKKLIIVFIQVDDGILNHLHTQHISIPECQNRPRRDEKHAWHLSSSLTTVVTLPWDFY